ncbi:hypothetical protein A9Q77_09265 [Marinomonas sp. 42_23_T18]|nr:hypothetical protein A9Q77_09265 [Marinomonas sp. 42_23_T18]
MNPVRLPVISATLVTVLSGFLCASLSFNAHAEGTFFELNEVQEEVGFYEPDYLIELAYGPSMTHIELGADFQKERNMGFAGLYFSRTQYDMTGSQTATMNAVGIRGLKNSSPKNDSIGADLHLGINQTKAGDYERTGIEFALSFYESLNDETSLLIGFSFRPEFLAIDWNEGVITESGYEFGVNHKFTPQMNLFAKYYYENLWQDNISSERIDDGILAGLNYQF